MGISRKETEQVAELLADHIIQAGQATKDNTQCLIGAINAMYGSLEMFYEQFYQKLNSQTLQEFGQLVDQAVQQKKHAQSNFASIINSDIFKKIIRNFSQVKTSLAGDANHALPISPHGTVIAAKPATKGKPDKER